MSSKRRQLTSLLIQSERSTRVLNYGKLLLRILKLAKSRLVMLVSNLSILNPTIILIITVRSMCRFFLSIFAVCFYYRWICPDMR